MTWKVEGWGGWEDGGCKWEGNYFGGGVRISSLLFDFLCHQESVERDGPSALQTTLPFDEKQVLVENSQYLAKALEVNMSVYFRERERAFNLRMRILSLSLFVYVP